MKKKDIIVIVVLCLLLGIGYFVFNHFQTKEDIIEVYYNQKLIKEIDINKNHLYKFEGDYGCFYLEVKNQQYRAIDVECPNHNCEKVGWVKKGSSIPIVCVPNDIYVIQKGQNEQFQ